MKNLSQIIKNHGPMEWSYKKYVPCLIWFHCGNLKQIKIFSWRVLSNKPFSRFFKRTLTQNSLKLRYLAILKKVLLYTSSRQKLNSFIFWYEVIIRESNYKFLKFEFSSVQSHLCPIVIDVILLKNFEFHQIKRINLIKIQVTAGLDYYIYIDIFDYYIHSTNKYSKFELQQYSSNFKVSVKWN